MLPFLRVRLSSLEWNSFSESWVAKIDFHLSFGPTFNPTSVVRNFVSTADTIVSEIPEPFKVEIKAGHITES